MGIGVYAVAGGDIENGAIATTRKSNSHQEKYEEEKKGGMR